VNKKILWAIIIIIGAYLLVGNTIISVLFNYAGTTGFEVPLDSEEYWANWWLQYGIITVAIAIAGLILIILGIRVFMKKE